MAKSLYFSYTTILRRRLKTNLLYEAPSGCFASRLDAQGNRIIMKKRDRELWLTLQDSYILERFGL